MKKRRRSELSRAAAALLQTHSCWPHQVLSLLLSLLLLSLVTTGCCYETSPLTSATLTATRPTLRLLRASRTAGSICPCAYLERGGFWSGGIATGLGVSNGVYVDSRCRCSYEFNCVRRWSQSSKSLTVTWIGSQGVSASQIQLQFCSSIYHSAAEGTCRPGQVTFTLRQIGWWVDLHRVFCRCPPAGGSAGSGSAAIHRFVYAKPVTYGHKFNGRLVDFVCDSKPVCQLNEWCYEESLNSDRLLTHGVVACTCPSGTYCPIYHIGGSTRVPVYFNDTEGSAVLIGYRLGCRS